MLLRTSAPALALLLAPLVRAPLPAHPVARAAAHPAVGTGTDSLALVGGVVHTMKPGEEPRIATVLIEDGRVTSIGRDLELPAGCVRIDLAEKHVVPALIDGYVNFDAEHDLLYTMAGIGVVRDLGGDHTQRARERKPEARARAMGPHLLTAGAAVDGDPPSSTASVILRSPGIADELLPILFEEGIDFVSCMPGLAPEVHRRVIELAHERGLDVWGPVGAGTSLSDTLAAGQDGIHFLDGLRPPDVDWRIVQPDGFRPAGVALVKAGAALIPLMMATERQLHDQSARPDAAALLRLLSPTYAYWWQSELTSRLEVLTPEAVALTKRIVQKRAVILKLLFDLGVRLTPGSGSAQPWLFPGRALHQELALWQDAGIPAADLLRLATHDAAQTFGLGGRYGTIEAGAVASLVVTRGDPSENIRALTDIEHIIVRGRPLDTRDLEDLIASIGKQQDEARVAFNAEVDVPAPPVPDGGEVILAGVVETSSFGLRLRTERFQVVRLPDDKLAFVGRVVYARHSNEGPSEMLVTQTTEGGKLVSAEVVLQRGDAALRFEGMWTAASWRMRRSAGSEVLGVKSTLERPFVVDVGSVTTQLVLGQVGFLDRFPILTLHAGLVPETAIWSMELDDLGQHQVRTHKGRLAFRFDDVGAPELGLEVVGQRVVETRLLERAAFGGPGLLLPEEVRSAIEARRSGASESPPPATPGPTKAERAPVDDEDAGDG